jgi:HAD superfamily hydrolase (TIGR01458 family)
MGIRGLLLDLDGVFHVGDRLLPGAVETIAFLRARSIPFRILTNTTTQSRASLVARMRHLGVPLELGDVITAPFAAALYLRVLKNPRCRFVVTPDTRADFAEFIDHETDPGFIILGDFEDQVSYPMLNSIFNQMMDGAELIALHKGRYWEVESGLKVDLGLFVAGLEFTTGKTATIIGKPSPTVFQLALQDLGLRANECAMIGDDILNDVAGAQNAGMAGILIRTGKYRPMIDSGHAIVPDKSLGSLYDVPSLFAR